MCSGSEKKNLIYSRFCLCEQPVEILASRKSIYKQITALPHYAFRTFSMQYCLVVKVL